MLGAKHNTISQITHSIIYRWKEKSLPKEVLNQLLSLQLVTRQKYLILYSYFTDFFPKATEWTTISKESLSDKGSQLITKSLFQLFVVFRSGCVTSCARGIGACSCSQHYGMPWHLPWELAKTNDFFFLLSEADLWNTLSCSVFPSSFLGCEYCLGWAMY